MNPLPINCTSEEVRGILEGRKTQIRRLVKLQPPCQLIALGHVEKPNNSWTYPGNKGKFWKAPLGPVGRRLIVTQGAQLFKGQSKEERFWSRVYKFNSCWEWFGSLNRKGYGLIRWGKKQIASQRVSWLIHNGNIPDGMHVLHKCDLSWCVNPEHLYLGTNDQNIRDKVDRGRMSRQRGSDNGGSKLTWEQVKEIRSLYWEQNIFQKEISDQFGITQPQVSKIVHNKRWSGETVRPNKIDHRTLEVTEIRCQRIQDISESDAISEGVTFSYPEEDESRESGGDFSRPARASFKTLWNSLHSHDSWDQNPFVWAYTFKRVEGGTE